MCVFPPLSRLHFLCALQCGTVVSINRTLENGVDLVCIIKALSVLNLVTFNALDTQNQVRISM